MRYITAMVMLGFGVLAVFLLYQSRSPKSNSGDSSPAVAEHPHTGMAAAIYSGKVIETMDAGGYTYVHVDAGREKIWAAGPLTVVEVGNEVSFATGMQMTNFRSETLDRTFASIYFVPAINRGAAPMPGPSHHANIGQDIPDLDYADITVPSGGNRIASVYENKKRLAGKEVVVRGKVVKFTPGVMQRNWIHLRDGSGDDGTNDLTVTTNATADVGDVVMVKGTLGVDKDFGFGYSYQVIVENATVTAE